MFAGCWFVYTMPPCLIQSQGWVDYCVVVGIMSRCLGLHITSSDQWEGPIRLGWPMRGQESVHTDSDAYNSQIMEQIVQSDGEDMTPDSVKNPMLILAHKKIRRYPLQEFCEPCMSGYFSSITINGAWILHWLILKWLKRICRVM